MSNEGKTELAATDLPIALYLNQRLTFDVLASLENGFSHFSTEQKTSSGQTSQETSGGTQIGISNVFAILGVSFGADVHASQGQGQSQSKSTTEQRSHTPASLFAKLRKDLRGRCLVRDIANSSELSAIQPGEFVEFEATLRKNPLIELLSTFAELVPLVEGLNVGAGSKTRPNQRKKPRNESDDVLTQVNSLLSATTAAGSQDLLAHLDTMRFVLTTEQNYFIDPTMNDIIDGTFRVFGKATRVIPEGKNESISLLRKTAIGKMGGRANKLGTEMARFKDSGFDGDLETEVAGPTMQVIPIAIFS